MLFNESKFSAWYSINSLKYIDTSFRSFCLSEIEKIRSCSQNEFTCYLVYTLKITSVRKQYVSLTDWLIFKF